MRGILNSNWIGIATGVSLLSASLLSIGVVDAPDVQATDGKADYDLSAIATLSRNAAFQQFTADFWPKARAKGVSRRLYTRVMRDLTPNPKVIELDGNQAEFNTPVWDYLAKRVSDARIQKGRAMLQEHRRLVRAIEKRTGVDRHVILAIWGMETNYGGYKGELSTIRSLATLAYTGRRKRFGRQQLLAALQILQKGDIAPEQMTGSWAGAMGHTQFIPTTYNAYAVDWTGDGKRDIWNSVADATASTANYLRKSGWKKIRPWGWEVKLPKGFDFSKTGRAKRRSVAAWAKMGVRPIRGGNYGVARQQSWIVLPAGAKGPAFLVTQNFKAILAYNNSIAYALSVAHLSDRIRGSGPIVGRWPKDDPQLSRNQRKELQALLAGKGHYKGEVSGRVGRKTRAAIVSYQQMAGLPPDGYPSRKLLERLRRNR
ncbi:MAG: lytic murein transglycosylase [Rhizobiales bacterium]|nr:lytic murein transglycosylase [Hyphomicrobiales bacterium]